jgi:hypothetical protein
VNTGAVSYRLCDRLGEPNTLAAARNDMLLSGAVKIALYV